MLVQQRSQLPIFYRVWQSMASEMAVYSNLSVMVAQEGKTTNTNRLANRFMTMEKEKLQLAVGRDKLDWLEGLASCGRSNPGKQRKQDDISFVRPLHLNYPNHPSSVNGRETIHPPLPVAFLRASFLIHLSPSSSNLRSN
jgi:hypothetical protein